MRRRLSLIAVLGLLVIPGCGDDEEPAETGAGGATGTEGVSTGGFMTAGDFIDAPIPDQVDEVETIVGVTPECDGVDASPGEEFQVGVAINAAQASPETPLADIVADQCGG